MSQKGRSVRSTTHVEDNDGWKEANQQESRCCSRPNPFSSITIQRERNQYLWSSSRTVLLIGAQS